jgi:ABC-type multidrug transport system fused ATPase/permease subunit
MVDFLIFNNEKDENFKIKSKELRRENLNIMKRSESPKKDRSEFIFALISIISGIIVLIILLYVFLIHPSEKAVGERFVTDELTFYTPIYQFHFKPITLFVIFSLIFLTFGLEACRTKLATEIPFFLKKIIFLLFFISIFILSYELILNFSFWVGTYILTSGEKPIDTLSYLMNPVSFVPRNFNFITKLYSLFLFFCLYGAYFFHGILKKDNN